MSGSVTANTEPVGNFRLPGSSSDRYAGRVTSDLARLNREIAEHRKHAGAGAALIAYSLALFAFGLAAMGIHSLGIVLIALAVTFFLFGVGAAALHIAYAASCARRIRSMTRLPVARLLA